MSSSQPGRVVDRGVDNGRALRVFALVAVPSGWIFLGIPIALGIPVEPFVLLTLLVGLVLPAVLLTRRDPGASMRSLLGDCIRPSRPIWLMLPALAAIPVLSWGVASVIGGAEDVDAALVGGVLLNIASSLLIVNLWEEMAWMGFFQRRAMSRWGSIRGSLVTATLFVGIHFPLAFVGADDGRELLINIGILVGSSVGLRLLLAFVDLTSSGSILTVAILHASWNASGEVLEAHHDWVRYVVTILLGLMAGLDAGLPLRCPSAGGGMSGQVLRYAAFTDGGTGQPGGVVLDADILTPGQMLEIAETLGYSETAFVSSGSSAGTRGLRFFSPLAEVAFCGHATVATAVALAERIGTGDLRFETMAGVVDVRTESVDGTTIATLVSPPTSTRPATPDEVRRTLGALRWSGNDLDPALPAHVAFAGNHHLVLGARTRERLADLDYDFERLAGLMAEYGWTTVDLVYRDGPALFHARNPFPPGGVVEDPATGAAAAAFGGYLRDLALVTVPGQVTVLQGHDMGVPSRLLIGLDANDRRVRVTGAATRIP